MRRVPNGLLAGAALVAGAALALRLVLPPQVPLPLFTHPVRGQDTRDALAERLRAAAAPPRLEAGALRAFAAGEAASGPAGLGSVDQVHPPLDFQATAQEGGIRLSWVPDPRNPVEDLEYRLTRFVGDGSAEELAPTTRLEWLDPAACEGIPYQYRIQTVVRRRIAPAGAPERVETRASEPAAASCVLPRRAEWTATGPDEEGRIALTLRRPGLPEEGPHWVSAGSPVGTTGWFLEGLTLQETSLEVETRIPRFDAWGRRVIINGRPADRTRWSTVRPLLASLRLSDPCGASVAVELVLPLDPASSESR